MRLTLTQLVKMFFEFLDAVNSLPPPYPFLNQTDLLHTLTYSLYKIHFIIILTRFNMKDSLAVSVFWFYNYGLRNSCSCYMFNLFFDIFMVSGGVKKKGKAITVTGRGGSLGCKTSRLSYFLDNKLTVGGEIVRYTRRPSFTLRKIPGTHLC
jgi:hypothetical protein